MAVYRTNPNVNGGAGGLGGGGIEDTDVHAKNTGTYWWWWNGGG